MKVFKIAFILTLVCLLPTKSEAQDSLQEKYDNMLETTETYEQYKVIPRTTLNSFWSEVTDSLNQNTLNISGLKKEVLTFQTEVEVLNSEKEAIKEELDKSLTLNDTIYFLGIGFSKIGYHLMVWLIIVVLAVLGVMSYFMFMRSNRVTTRVKKEHEELIAEFEVHKDKAREAQVKLKRELQTALNTLNERRS